MEKSQACCWRATFKGSTKNKTPATATINDLAVSSIDTEHAYNVLQPIWTRTPETASRIRQRCELVLGWATAHKYRSGANPFAWRGHLDKLLAKTSALKKLKGGKHHPALPHADTPPFMEELRGKDFISARALGFTILTASRTNEVINATWDEIDFVEKIWTVPAKRMKPGKEHRVPLTARVLQILSELPREDGNRFLFIGAKSGRPLSNMAMLESMKDCVTASCRTASAPPSARGQPNARPIHTTSAKRRLHTPSLMPSSAATSVATCSTSAGS
jgi:integrase